MISALQPLFSTIPVNQLVIVAMLVFARVGMCIMLLPGIGSARLPMQQRLFFAVAISFVTLSFVGPDLVALAKNQTPTLILLSLCSEALVGLSFGIFVHLFIWIVQLFGTFLAMVIGFSGQPGRGIIESTPETPLTSLISLSALFLFFASDLHLEVVRSLIYSYQLIPVTLMPKPQAALIDYVDGLSKSFLTLFHIAAPFVIYSVLINFSIGLLNKLTPAIPIYFVTMPMVIMGGVFLFYIFVPELLNFFIEEMRAFIETG